MDTVGYIEITIRCIVLFAGFFGNAMMVMSIVWRWSKITISSIYLLNLGCPLIFPSYLKKNSGQPTVTVIHLGPRILVNDAPVDIADSVWLGIQNNLLEHT